MLENWNLTIKSSLVLYPRFLFWGWEAFSSADEVVSLFCVWMHHMDASKTHREKAWWELHKNATNYLEQILEAASHKTAAVQQLTSHFKNHVNKMKKMCDTAGEARTNS